jgi:hypothetical protein
MAAAAAMGCTVEDGLPPIPAGGWPQGSPDFLFAMEEILEFEIELNEESWDQLAARGRDFVPATFRWADWELPVGVRIKGRGSFRRLESGEKSAFKVDFNRYREEGEFFGLKKLTLNNMIHDKSLATEAVAYQAFRELDLPTPRIAYAWLRVNGEPWGLYLLIEPTDDRRYLEHHFGAADGNLYEGAYTLGAEELHFSDVLLDRYHLFEHDRVGFPPERLDLLTLSAALATSSPEDLPQLMERWLDLESFMRYVSAEVYTAHWDGYIGNSNNFEVYYDPNSGRFHFMPWGTDDCFKAHTACRPLGCPRGGRETPGILFQHLWDLSELRAPYLEQLTAVVQDLEEADLVAYHSALRELIAPTVAEDPMIDFGLSEFELFSDRLSSFLHDRPERVRSMLD